MDSKDTRQVRAQKLVAGLKKHLAKAKTITFGGKEYKIADLIEIIQAAGDATEDCANKKAAYHASVDVEAKALAAMTPIALGLRTYIYLTYGNASATLADFGLTPRTRKAPDVETKADAADKMRATRKARKILGKRQREELGDGSRTTDDADATDTTPSTPGAASPTTAAAKPATASN